MLILFTAGELVAVGNLFQIDIGIAQQGTENVGLYEGTKSGAAKVMIEYFPLYIQQRIMRAILMLMVHHLVKSIE